MNNFTKSDDTWDESQEPEGGHGAGFSEKEAHGVEQPQIEPLTLSLMGKLFGVPLLIVGTIVAGAVLVVLLFGGPASPPQRSVAELLQVLESTSGEKSLGVLLPREKELWQTALELAKRLEKKEVEVSNEDLGVLTDRLGALVLTDLGNVDRLPTVEDERNKQRAVRSKRLEFLIHALGRTERDEAVTVLLQVIRSGHEPYSTAAMKELADLKALPSSRDAIGPMLDVLTSQTTSVEAKLVACTAISALAERGTSTVISGLVAARGVGAGELDWAASLALARMGSTAGKTTLLDMLDRSFWESGERYVVVDESGATRRFSMPAGRVNSFLMAAIEAVRGLDDADLWEMVHRLKSDKTTAVRAAAGEALKGRAERTPLPENVVAQE